VSVRTADVKRWSVTYQAKPMLSNETRRQSWHAVAAMTREWREVFGQLAAIEGAEACDVIAVTVDHVKAGKGKVPDVCACAPSVKAAIDGLVDAGIIPDDGPRHLRSVTFNAPTRGTVDSVTLTIEEPQ
jgi:hypothetical protein